MGECKEEIDNPTTLDNVTLPERVAGAIERMQNKHMTGQILLNFNGGAIQSFEMKEHHRL